MFKQQYSNADETLHRCLAAGDAETAIRLAHSIKAAAAGIGATELAEASADLEKAAGEEGHGPDACLQRFGISLGQTLETVTRLLAKEVKQEKPTAAFF